MKTVTQRLLAMIALVFVIGALGLLVRQFASLDWMVENETRMREFVQQQRWQSWFLGLIIYTVFSLVPGTAGKSVVFGWLFGFWQAVLLVDIGLTIAACGGFLAARFIVRRTVTARFGGLIKKLDRRLTKEGWFYLLMMRMAHLPFSFVNYGVGATSVPFRTFCWTTAVGILPGTMIFVFVGTRIPTLADLSENGAWQMLDPILFSLLAATVLFPVLIRGAIRYFQKRKGSKANIDLAELESVNSWPLGRQTNGAN